MDTVKLTCGRLIGLNVCPTDLLEREVQLTELKARRFARLFGSHEVTYYDERYQRLVLELIRREAQTFVCEL